MLTIGRSRDAKGKMIVRRYLFFLIKYFCNLLLINILESNYILIRKSTLQGRHTSNEHLTLHWCKHTQYKYNILYTHRHI